MVAMARRFTSRNGVGYSVLHCRTVMSDLLVPLLVSTLTAALTSLRSAMPVDRMTLRPSRPILRRYGRLVISPDGILNVRRPRRLKRSMLARSNGEERKVMPFFRQ